MPVWELVCTDCRMLLPVLASESVDLVVTDPPYVGIDRGYGSWTADAWFGLMRDVVPQVRRVLKPRGSAVFILQPTSERLGRMRTWVWDFLSWVGREYGLVQDLYWWNTSAIPESHAIQGRLCRPSVKPIAWLGRPDCYRSQGAVLWTASQRATARAAAARAGRRYQANGHRADDRNFQNTARRRGGVTPMNLLPFGGGRSGGDWGHTAGTPLELCRWLVRYLCPPGGTALDHFSGVATAGVAALREGRNYAGLESLPPYHEAARRRLEALGAPARQEPVLRRVAGAGRHLSGLASESGTATRESTAGHAKL